MSLGTDKIFNLPVEEIDKIDLSGYPLFYSTDYKISQVRIGSIVCSLIEANHSIKLSVIVKMVQTLEAKQGLPCIVSTTKLTDYQKKRFIELGIAYIISPNNLYIPFLGLSILQSKNALPAKPKLSAQAQSLALHIIDGSWVGLSVTEVARKMNRSLSSISNYVKEIEAFVPQATEKYGTSKVLANNQALTKGESFKLFEPFLSNPVKDSIYVKCNGEQEDLLNDGYLYAGVSALSKYTMLGDDPWKTFAVSESVWYRSEHTKELTAVTIDDDPDVLIEIWKYSPESKDGKTVDAVSLYLSLKDDPQLKDPRGEEALAELFERIMG